jgi:membrane-associated phospholipid phosphatase
VQRILFDVYNSLGLSFINGFYGDFNHHPVAAVPSMHMSLTLLPMIYLILGGRLLVKLIAVALTLFMQFIIVYLGEHYVFDAFIGMFYAVLAYYLTELVFLLIERRAAPESAPAAR